METGRYTEYLGKGIGFPIELDGGKHKTLKEAELIRLSIPNILAWDIGTRYFNGSYGSKWGRLIERPLDYITLDLVRFHVIEAIHKYEKRIELISVFTSIVNEKLYIHLKYKIIIDNTTDTFILPFYNIINQ